MAVVHRSEARVRRRARRLPREGPDRVVVIDAPLLLRALEIYELDRVDFAAAYLVASAEASGVGKVASFDRSIDRISTVQRIEPT